MGYIGVITHLLTIYWLPGTSKYPTIYRVLYIPGGCLGFLPSTVAKILWVPKWKKAGRWLKILSTLTPWLYRVGGTGGCMSDVGMFPVIFKNLAVDICQICGLHYMLCVGRHASSRGKFRNMNLAVVSWHSWMFLGNRVTHPCIWAIYNDLSRAQMVV